MHSDSESEDTTASRIVEFVEAHVRSSVQGMARSISSSSVDGLPGNSRGHRRRSSNGAGKAAASLIGALQDSGIDQIDVLQVGCGLGGGL